MSFSIEPVLQLVADAFSACCHLRNQLWPMNGDQCEREAAEVAGNSRWVVFAARLEDGTIAGFLEVSLRD